MAKAVKKYLDYDCLQAAKDRLKEIFYTFDTVVVSFSGGKDSLVVLELAWQVKTELGIKGKLTVRFLDEEIIPESVLSFIEKYRNDDRFDFNYFCVPLISNKYVLGKTYEYIQWDPARKHIRPIPQFAITDKGGKIYSQYTASDFIARKYKGKIAELVGIRADESINRLGGILAKINKPYVQKTEHSRCFSCKVIYDWSEKDIFKFLYDNKIPYCKEYDLQLFNGDSFRVATPLHAEAAKKFHKLKTREPIFYQQVVNLFPEMILQEKYFNSLKKITDELDDYYPTKESLYEFTKKYTDPSRLEITLKFVDRALKQRENGIKKGQQSKGGYFFYYLFQKVRAGIKRPIPPKPYSMLSKKAIEFENKLSYDSIFS